MVMVGGGGGGLCVCARIEGQYDAAKALTIIDFLKLMLCLDQHKLH